MASGEKMQERKKNEEKEKTNKYLKNNVYYNITLNII